MNSNPHVIARRRAGFPHQEDLARAIGYATVSVTRWECGSSPYPRWLVAYLRVCEANERLKATVHSLARQIDTLHEGSTKRNGSPAGTREPSLPDQR